MAEAAGPGAPDGGEPGREPRRRRPVLVASAVVALVVVLLVVVLAVAREGGDDSADTPLLGQPAPAIQARTLDGGSFDLASRRGSWVVLNFFASWCPPCKQEAPELARFAADQAAQGASGAELIGVVYNDDAESIRQFLADAGGQSYPVVLDEGSGSAIDYGVVKVPETWVIDPDGIVAARFVSTVTAGQLDEVLAELQAARP